MAPPPAYPKRSGPPVMPPSPPPGAPPAYQARQSVPQQPAVAPAPYGAQLTIWYGGQPYPVNKDRFVIGRGKQSSDLTIKDPNVSRQHAMVEFLNGQYYMVDMGSTNGIEYNGQRIARKAVQDGDVFRICDHDLRFTFR